MRLLKTTVLATLTTMTAMAFAVASSAMAESLALCLADESPCSAEQVFTHVHEVTPSSHPAILKTTILTVECDTLFLGDVIVDGEPLEISGNFTYSNCTKGCEATETSKNSTIETLKEGHEKAAVTGKGSVHLICGASIDCSYNGTGLVGTAKGPLLATQTNGEVTFTEQAVTKEAGGFLCPKTAKLDITTTPLSATNLGESLNVTTTANWLLTVGPTYSVTLVNTSGGPLRMLQEAWVNLDVITGVGPACLGFIDRNGTCERKMKCLQVGDASYRLRTTAGETTWTIKCD